MRVKQSMFLEHTLRRLSLHLQVCPISWDGAWSDEAMSFTSNRLFNKEVEVELIDEDYDILFAELYVDVRNIRL